MEQNNNTTKERGGKHLNYEERQNVNWCRMAENAIRSFT